MAGPRLTPLGDVADNPVQLAVTDRPWTVGLDALVVSTGIDGVGRLGGELLTEFPDADWSALDANPLAPDRPALIELPPPAKDLRWVIAATVRDTTRTSVEAPGTLDAVGRATRAALRVADEIGAVSVGLPLIGAGNIGLPPGDVAFAIVRATRSALRERGAGPRPLAVVLVGRDDAQRRAVETAWGYGRLLEAARDEVVVGRVMTEAGSGLDPRALRAALDVDEDELWEPALPQLAALREIDAGWESLDEERRVEVRRQRVLAVDAVIRTLVTHSFEPRLRLAINRQREAQSSRIDRREHHRRRLGTVDTSALRGLPNLDALVVTSAQAELDELLDPTRAPRGSIGVAGPRGCGKSTLLVRAHQHWGDRGIRILIPAPATYVPREFLLHLYRRVCEYVLHGEQKPALTPVRRPHQQLALHLLLLVVGPAAVLVAGLVGLVAGLTTGPARASDRLGLAGAALLLVTALAVLVGPPGRIRAGLTQRGRPPGTLWTSTWPRYEIRPPRVGRLLLGVAAGAVVLAVTPIWLSPRTAVAAALVTTAVLTMGTPRRLAPADVPDPTIVEALWLPRVRVAGGLAAVVAAQLVAVVAGLVLLNPWLAVPLSVPVVAGTMAVAAGTVALLIGVPWYRLMAYEAGLDPIRRLGEVERQATLDLARIRYQTSVVSGWTSTVKLSPARWLPFGVDAGATGSTTEADQPLGIPDIVHGIKTLLRDRGPSLVAIDELDKIESVDRARDFLNEIKGVMDGENAYFLVSMSEDAIASFERRGLPFRDVFDSAFDEVVRAPYLTYAQARTLISGRVTDVPSAFIGLAYCLSGGLPRDLLRAMGRITSFANQTPEPVPVAGAAREVVQRDLLGKTTAVSAAIRTIVIEPAVSSVLRCFHDLDTEADGWLAGFQAIEPIADPQATDLDKRRELRHLSVELLGYAYYCRTLLELFRTEEDEDVDRLAAILDRDDGARLDSLVKARQTFAVNPFVAWEQLTAFRAAEGLAVFALPPALSAATAATAATGPGATAPRATSPAATAPAAAQESAGGAVHVPRPPDQRHLQGEPAVGDGPRSR